MCIAIVCFQSVTALILNLTFLIKPFFYMTKKPREKLNIVRTKRVFKVKKSLSVAKNYLRPENAHLVKIHGLRNITNDYDSSLVQVSSQFSHKPLKFSQVILFVITRRILNFTFIFGCLGYLPLVPGLRASYPVPDSHEV